jgi:L-aspartate oxidase
MVRTVVERGPENIRWLLDEGVQFTRDEQYRLRTATT